MSGQGTHAKYYVLSSPAKTPFLMPTMTKILRHSRGTTAKCAAEVPDLFTSRRSTDRVRDQIEEPISTTPVLGLAADKQVRGRHVRDNLENGCTMKVSVCCWKLSVATTYANCRKPNWALIGQLLHLMHPRARIRRCPNPSAADKQARGRRIRDNLESGCTMNATQSSSLLLETIGCHYICKF